MASRAYPLVGGPLTGDSAMADPERFDMEAFRQPAWSGEYRFKGERWQWVEETVAEKERE
jgi:hypothetical protein